MIVTKSYASIINFLRVIDIISFAWDLFYRLFKIRWTQIWSYKLDKTSRVLLDHYNWDLKIVLTLCRFKAMKKSICSAKHLVLDLNSFWFSEYSLIQVLYGYLLQQNIKRLHLGSHSLHIPATLSATMWAEFHIREM